MMKKYLQFILALLLSGLGGNAFAQSPTTQGTEFWLSFMKNGYRNSNPSAEERLTLIASAKEACTVTVTNPIMGYSQSFYVNANDVNTFTVDDQYGYNDQNEGVASKGLYVTATDTISLYIANEAENSYDAANVLPVQALGSHYLIQSNKSIGEQQSHYNENRASFLVVATQDNTEVRITPVCQTWNGHLPGETYVVTLDAGETYHVKNDIAGSNTNADGDFTGTIVESPSDKPIAVFNGNCITAVPGGTTTGYDHVFEQAMPTDHWGNRFVVTSIKQKYTGMSADMVKVTALNDNTTVTRDGTPLAQLNAGESASFNLELNTNPCSYLESDNPVAVYMYNHSHGSDSNINYGDPSMVWISPVEQTVYEVTFSTFQAEHVTDHFVNVVCYTDHVSELTLDGNSISESFQTVSAAPVFSYARVEIAQGAHTLHCPGGFVAYVYGYGDVEGYAYTVGSSAKILTRQLYVDDIPSTNLPDGYTACQNEPVNFRVETNYEIDHVAWSFGDGGTGTGEAISHSYVFPGDFNVKSIVYRNMDNIVQPFDTLTVIIHVNAPYQLLIDTVACMEYVFRDSIFTTSGRHEYLVEKEGECDSIYIFNLAIGIPPEHPERTITSCVPRFVWGHLFDHTMDTIKQFTIDGCVHDSVLHFILLEGGDVFDTIVECDSYLWHNGTGVETLTESGDYVDTIIGANGCESYLHLNLTINHTPPFHEIKGWGNVPVATNYWPAEYNYFLDDSTGMDTNEVIWELSDNENGEWQFRPHGASCTVVTYAMGAKVLRARSIGHGSCDNEVSLTINCSGYAVDESELSRLKVYPNPAKKELIVEGEQLTSIVIYNLLGQKVKVVETTQESMLRVEVNDLPQALYLVHVSTRYGNKTQIISVTR